MKQPDHWHYGNELTKTMWDSVEEKDFTTKIKIPYILGWLKQQDDIDKVIQDNTLVSMDTDCGQKKLKDM